MFFHSAVAHKSVAIHICCIKNEYLLRAPMQLYGAVKK